jgi:hypothetical protein
MIWNLLIFPFDSKSLQFIYWLTYEEFYDDDSLVTCLRVRLFELIYYILKSTDYSDYSELVKKVPKIK